MLLDKEGKNEPFFLNDPWISMNITPQIASQDTIELSIQSYPFGKEITKSLILDISLQEYPSSTKASVPFDVTYRVCNPDNFRGS